MEDNVKPGSKPVELTIEKIQQIIGVNRIKYDELTANGIGPKKKHVFFFIEMGILLSRVRRMSELADTPLEGIYEDAAAIEILNLAGHYRNFFYRHHGCRFTCVFYPGTIQSYDNSKGIWDKVELVCNFLPNFFVLKPMNETAFPGELHKIVSSICVRLRASVHTKGGNTQFFFMTKRDSDHLHLRLGEDTVLLHRSSNAKGEKILNVKRLENKDLPTAEFLHAYPMLLLFERIFHENPASRKLSIHAKENVEQAKRWIKHDGMGKKTLEMTQMLIARVVPEEDKVRVKNFILSYVYDGDGSIVAFAEKTIKLWRQKLYGRDLNDLREILSGFETEQQLNMDWLH